MIVVIAAIDRFIHTLRAQNRIIIAFGISTEMGCYLFFMTEAEYGFGLCDNWLKHCRCRCTISSYNQI